MLQGENDKLRQEVAGLKKIIEDRDWASKKTDTGIRALYRELEMKNERLKKLDLLKSQFVANVSHELKNPLATIKESIDLVLDGVAGELNPKQTELLIIGVKTINRLVRLVGNLLDLSKMESGKVEMKRQNFDMAALIKEVLKVYEIKLSKKQIVLDLDLPQETDLIWADRDMLSEVVINLLTNAIKFTPVKGKIDIRLKPADRDVRFEIFNSGPGISKGDFEKIFDKFECLTSEIKEGVGLGLSISRDIVRLHKGRIWVESGAGKGSRFIFVLPRDLREQQRH